MLLNSESAERLARELQDIAPVGYETYILVGRYLLLLGSAALVQADMVEDGELHANLNDFASESLAVGTVLTMMKKRTS